HFKTIADSASELWTLICPKFPLKNDQVLFWLDVLARSKARLIDVVVNAQAKTTGATQPYEVFIAAVIGHSDRWRKFEITSDTWEPIALFLGQSHHLVPLPRLEELVLYRSENPGRRTNWEVQGLAPKFLSGPLYPNNYQCTEPTLQSTH
ncbi:hypothetical protein BJ322DRAFT_1015035, partial [Thelephora terrestris]